MMNKKFFALLMVTTALAVLAAMAAAPYVGQRFAEPQRMAAAWADNYETLDAMKGDVDAVVVATVIGVRPGRQMVTGGGAPLPFTNVELQVDDAIKGVVAPVIVLEQTGGDVASQSYYIDGDGGQYEVGERVMLFLKQQPDTERYYLANPQGRFHIQRGKLEAVDPDAPVARDLHGESFSAALTLIRN